MTVAHVTRFASRMSLLTAVFAAGGVQAQSAIPSATQGATQSDTTRRQKLFTTKDAYIALGFVGATFALYPVDKSMAQRLQNENSFASKSIDHWATGFDYLASPGVFVLSAGAYIAGRLTHHPDMADFGWHTTEAALVGLGVTEVLKGAVGRARPYATADTNPRDFKPGSGFTNGARQSFPSGHATIAFSAAAAATVEIQRLWPRWTWVAGPIFYGSASLVGLARMYQNQHWASDVVLGAGIGTFAGLKTVRYTHIHPHNLMDRILLNTSIGPDGRGGAALIWSAPLR
jgi:membrane-associated phospholipid phosphatase